MISGIIFKSLIHFELIFLYSVRLGSGSYLFCMWLSSFPIYWRYYPLSIVYSLLFCHKLLARICMGVFLGSQFCFIDLSVFFANSMLFWLLWLCCLKSGSEILPALFFFFLRITLVTWGLLWFHINLRIFFFYFCEECPWDFAKGLHWICRLL